MKLAVSGTKYESLTSLLTGPITVTCGADPISISKTLVSFAKEETKLEIIGGATVDENLDLSKIQLLASLPSFDEIRAKLLSVLQEPGAKLVRLLAAYAEKA
jgi:large subunit ribosomal protein L10